jgi:hypothetical protein
VQGAQKNKQIVVDAPHRTTNPNKKDEKWQKKN